LLTYACELLSVDVLILNIYAQTDLQPRRAACQLFGHAMLLTAVHCYVPARVDCHRTADDEYVETCALPDLHPAHAGVVQRSPVDRFLLVP
jgi:hypothetical protein